MSHVRFKEAAIEGKVPNSNNLRIDLRGQRACDDPRIKATLYYFDANAMLRLLLPTSSGIACPGPLRRPIFQERVAQLLRFHALRRYRRHQDGCRPTPRWRASILQDMPERNLLLEAYAAPKWIGQEQIRKKRGFMRNSILIAAFALVFSLALNVSAQAATLGDVAAAIAAPSKASQSTNDWTSFSKLKGVKWKGSAPVKGGNTYYWNGATTIDGVGRGEVSTSGSKTSVMTAAVTATKLVDRNKLPQVLVTQFPKDTKLELIRGALPGRRNECLAHLSCHSC